jgi:hypothetical protein
LGTSAGIYYSFTIDVLKAGKTQDLSPCDQLSLRITIDR